MGSSIDDEIRSLGQEIRVKTEALAKLRQSRPPEDVSDYTLQDGQGNVSLAALFGERQDLILIHNMGRSCPYCTLWADGLNGLRKHLEDRAALALCSPDAPDVQAAFAQSRGWGFRMASDAEGRFTADMGFREEKDGRAHHAPGYSTFRKHDDGTITRIASDSFGPGDVHCGAWHMFELLDGGTGGWQPKFTYD